MQRRSSLPAGLGVVDRNRGVTVTRPDAAESDRLAGYDFRRRSVTVVRAPVVERTDPPDHQRVPADSRRIVEGAT